MVLLFKTAFLTSLRILVPAALGDCSSVTSARSSRSIIHFVIDYILVFELKRRVKYRSGNISPSTTASKGLLLYGVLLLVVLPREIAKDLLIN